MDKGYVGKDLKHGEDISHDVPIGLGAYVIDANSSTFENLIASVVQQDQIHNVSKFRIFCMTEDNIAITMGFHMINQ